MKTFDIQNENHTVGCLLRPRLFAEGARFAACIVKHPKDTFMSIQIDADDDKQCILSAVKLSDNIRIIVHSHFFSVV